MRLSPRLRAVAQMAKDGKVIIDVGTDHAHVPIFIAKTYSPRAIYAADLKPGPLATARTNIEQAGLSHVIQTRLSDGLDAFSDVDADTIIIAGMGGLNIWDIMSNCRKQSVRWILQPMTAGDKLRALICEKGYKIDQECVAIENEKFYYILSVTNFI